MWPGTAPGGHDPDELTSYTVTPERVKLFLDVGEKLLFIDLRPIKDFRQKRLPGARSLPLAEVQKRFAEIPRAGRVILYCDCPWKEIDGVYLFLNDRGYRNVGVMEGGFSGWAKRKYPVESGWR